MPGENCEAIDSVQNTSDRPKWHGAFKNITSSIIAGTAVASCTFPAESLKKWLQGNQERLASDRQKLLHGSKSNWLPFYYVSSTAVTVLNAIKNREYIPYRGLSVFVINIVPTTTIQFAVDGSLKKLLPEDQNIYQSIVHSAACGAIGAVNATFVENTIIRQQEMKAGPIPTVKDMFKQSYVRPWKSFPCIATRDAIFTLFMLNFIPNSVEFSKDNFGESFALPTRILMSLLGTVLSHPFDTVATLQQKVHEKTPFVDVAKKLYQTQGVKGFYRGVLCRSLMFGTFAYALPEARKVVETQIDRLMP